MPPWICPNCQRQFGRRGQPHECAPAMSLDEYFSTGPARERPIFEAVMAHLETLGPVHVEPVSVGIMLKKASTFAELRPMVNWEALSFGLPRRIIHPRITKTMKGSGPRTWYGVRLREPADVDDQICDWLTESYLDAPA
jgi:hypothetical protein